MWEKWSLSKLHFMNWFFLQLRAYANMIAVKKDASRGAKYGIPHGTGNCRPCGGLRRRSPSTMRTAGFWGTACRRKHHIFPRWVITSDMTVWPLMRSIRPNTGSCTSGGKRPLNGSLPTPRKNTPCVIHSTEAWLRWQTGWSLNLLPWISKNWPGGYGRRSLLHLHFSFFGLYTVSVKTVGDLSG